MRNIQPGMNIAKQRRKLTQLAAEAPPSHVGYIEHLIRLFDAEVAAGRPTPASQFIPMYHEEFGL
ncbi:hypothetical protein SEA_SOYO_70 [Mycobacterium phage SoYo]|uniref:DnaB-like dsDNA helicase n=34 Tax=Microwolfvirus TaxID=2942894 RepID=A0A345L1I2_9CAUD|nr:hypothetical protein PBI_BXZ2_68 [Mycobacterium phage Bxz2]YP_009198498.1 hypothetical protein AVV34_gp27 [Mycobacterium phage MarQuardt]AEK07729.1 hypothetical protein VIX_69 [Mycobacterium phage Vix]AIM51213.1 hypothetical protein PBI_FARBER_73 [Mycobacterium phage Farber]AJA41856.1 hypothetical protein PBI_SPIKE509_73 [Mycobacterium phage Spike509]AJA41947.1 hypothetical protein PBI_PHOXY_73 [Mycobacterium phage Phoxy]AJA43461.1 hypothetical protein PBI_TAURUS_74 [Mycobacterium phage Ta